MTNKFEVTAAVFALFVFPIFVLASTCPTSPPKCPAGEVLYADSNIIAECFYDRFVCKAQAASNQPPALGATPKSDAKPTATKPVSRPLSYGARGSDVLSLQRKLISLGLLSSDSATGFFGRLTRDAVRSFQRANNLEPVGYIGPRTKKAIASQENAEALARGNSPTTESPGGIQPPATTIQFLLAQLKVLQDKIALLRGGTGTNIQTPIVTASGVGGGVGGGSTAPLSTRACTLGSSMISHGETLTLYRDATVAFGQSCLAETRTCSDGTLSGSFARTACDSANPNACASVDGVTL